MPLRVLFRIGPTQDFTGPPREGAVPAEAR
ncbi:hypothetical protein BJY18_001664 [Amycolatopsis jiangsuensis]|uniref:Uncharacterized protein n=1 Tax=Amycolatopsis jiangsuensis TaxID=1181879 RepID=A0A840IRL4_9PSEU|nr:hypothetical protein [Amycolatopsis jiangsuensis]